MYDPVRNSLKKNCWSWCLQVFLVRKIRGLDRGQLYAMKVLKKATLKGNKWRLKHELQDGKSSFPLNTLEKNLSFNLAVQGNKGNKYCDWYYFLSHPWKELIENWKECFVTSCFCSHWWAWGHTWLSQFSPWPTFVGIWCKWGYFVLLIQIAWFIYFLSKGIIVNEDVLLEKVELPCADLESWWHEP